MKHILCIDPGEGTGWAKMDLKGVLIEFENLTPDEVYDRLNDYPDPENLAHVIIEEWRTFRSKANKFTGNKQITTRVLGAAEAFCRKHKIVPVMQKPENKDTGAKWSGMKPPSNHSLSHRVDAYNHGFFFLRNTYQIPTDLERKAWSPSSD